MPDPTPSPAAPIDDPDGGLPRLLAIMARLRDPAAGCPWDIVQTFGTIAPYTIEEAYEVADAIERGDMGGLRDELGDLLLQVVYHARIAEEAGAFAFPDVVRGIADKMVRRHPHVFGPDSRDKTPDQQTRDWERIKAAEREGSPAAASALDGVALGLPALTRAVKLQNRAARVGFDWPDASAVLAKIAEETAELVEARDSGDADRTAEEYGDLMFVIANLARHLNIDPEASLRAANAKFTRRFHAIEAALAERGRTPAQSDLAEMDALWESAKQRGALMPATTQSDSMRRWFAALILASFAGLPSQAADCSLASTQTDMNACANANFNASDAELNALYRQITSRLDGDPGTAKLLVAAQRAWLGFRDAECALVASSVAGGSIQPMIHSECLDRLTRQRIADFEGFLACEEGDLNCPIPAQDQGVHPQDRLPRPLAPEADDERSLTARQEGLNADVRWVQRQKRFPAKSGHTARPEDIISAGQIDGG